MGVLRRAHFTNDNETARSRLPDPYSPGQRKSVAHGSTSSKGRCPETVIPYPWQPLTTSYRDSTGKGNPAHQAAREGAWASECLIPVMIFGAELKPRRVDPAAREEIVNPLRRSKDPGPLRHIVAPAPTTNPRRPRRI